MRVVPFLISAVVTIACVIALNKPWGSVPPIGSFVSPQQGFWQNAEPAGAPADVQVQSPRLKDKVSVYLDDRLVPHVFATNDEDLYFVQGYLHARFRLWQMEFQTHAAAGRLSEVLGAGPKNGYLNNDRSMRRLGIIECARKSLELMEQDPATKAIMNAYTAGVNAYIDNLTYASLPLEYRLLNYAPEHWSNFKTALFLKYMSDNLTGYESDIEYTNLKSVLSEADFNKCFPFTQDSLSPIVPRGTVFPAASVHPVKPAATDSFYFNWKDSLDIAALEKPDKDNGSNNWAVNGSKTKSGRPILCNDPHLGLNLPSLWYEMQLHTPQHNVYGVSFPGSPAIIIGFNDSCSWGVTNASRDVKDYYAIRFKDRNRQEYWYNDGWQPTVLNIDTFKVRGANDVLDTVAYTVFGPVIYDQSFNGKGRAKGHLDLALRWKAHDASNELKTFYLLNRANNYADYESAIANFKCPGQNFVFASKSNDIAIWQQGQFPARWQRQGDFIMPGWDSTYRWQDTIPQAENPHVLNPPSGYVSSANQQPADTAYPYYIGGHFDMYRGYIINRNLQQMSDITIGDMEKLQTSNYNVLAEMARPILLNNIDEAALSRDEKKWLDTLRNWNLVNDPNLRGPAVFQVWFDSLQSAVWSDELSAAPRPFVYPESYTLVEALRRDSAFSFIDNTTTQQVETLKDIVTEAFQHAVPVIAGAEKQHRLVWTTFKDAGVRHLLRMEQLSRYHLTTGGGANIINAIKGFHGPSWRMIVQLTDPVEAYGIYPGGQSGNPGSAYYDNFVSDWAAGKYHALWVMKKDDVANMHIISRMAFTR